mmetsp:Transcript_49606/g.142231  ORF Transcript_49606/g.142231 Transcript_49606/m.142231 type:complete len:101 (-) Transcript_49606:129-431(-)
MLPPAQSLHVAKLLHMPPVRIEGAPLEVPPEPDALSVARSGAQHPEPFSTVQPRKKNPENMVRHGVVVTSELLKKPKQQASRLQKKCALPLVRQEQATRV